MPYQSTGLGASKPDRQNYFICPALLAHVLEIEKGKRIDWVVEDRNHWLCAVARKRQASCGVESMGSEKVMSPGGEGSVKDKKKTRVSMTDPQTRVMTRWLKCLKIQV
jgi:hypothetical protein